MKSKLSYLLLSLLFSAFVLNIYAAPIASQSDDEIIKHLTAHEWVSSDYVYNDQKDLFTGYLLKFTADHKFTGTTYFLDGSKQKRFNNPKVLVDGVWSLENGALTIKNNDYQDTHIVKYIDDSTMQNLSYDSYFKEYDVFMFYKPNF